MLRNLLSIVFLFFYFVSISQFGNIPTKEQALKAALSLEWLEASIAKNVVFIRLKVPYVYQDFDEILSKSEDNIYVLNDFVKNNPALSDEVGIVQNIYNSIRLIPLSKINDKKIKNIIDLHEQFVKNNSLLISQLMGLTENSNINNLLYTINFENQEFGYYFALKNSGLFFDDLGLDITQKLNQSYNKLKKSIEKLINDKNFIDSSNVIYLRQLKSDMDLISKIIQNPSGDKFVNTIYNLINKIRNNINYLILNSENF